MLETACGDTNNTMPTNSSVVKNAKTSVTPSRLRQWKAGTDKGIRNCVLNELNTTQKKFWRFTGEGKKGINVDHPVLSFLAKSADLNAMTAVYKKNQATFKPCAH